MRNGDDKLPCPVCQGTGLVIVLLNAEPVEMQCARCLGTTDVGNNSADLLG